MNEHNDGNQFPCVNNIFLKRKTNNYVELKYLAMQTYLRTASSLIWHSNQTTEKILPLNFASQLPFSHLLFIPLKLQQNQIGRVKQQIMPYSYNRVIKI